MRPVQPSTWQHATAGVVMNTVTLPTVAADIDRQGGTAPSAWRCRLRRGWCLLPLALIIFFTLIDYPYLSAKIRTPPHQAADPMMMVSESAMLQTSNAGHGFRQAVFGTAFLLAVLGLWAPERGMLELLSRQKLMLLFLTYALLSIMWSPAPSLSLKRWILFAGMLFAMCSAMRAATAAAQAVRIMRGLFAFALLLSVLLYLWRPDVVTAPGGSFFVKAGTWQGIFWHKNSLASAALLAVALWLPCLWSQASRLERHLAPWVLLLVMFLAIKSGGKAALIGIIATIGFCLALKFPLQGKIKLLLAYMGMATIALWFLNFPQLPFASDLQATFQISGNLTGRVPLWQTLLEIFGQHPFLGVGYNAFWTASNLDHLSLIFAAHPWKPMQGHNGYIDILNQLGLVGGLLFFLVVMQSVWWAARSTFHAQDTSLTLCLLLFALLFINLVESYFCNSHSIVWVTFLLTHVALAKPPQLATHETSSS